MKRNVLFTLIVAVAVVLLAGPAMASDFTVVRHLTGFAYSDFVVAENNVLWFTQGDERSSYNHTQNLGRYDLDTDDIVYYKVPDQGSCPGTIILDKNGDPWILAAPVRRGHGPAWLYHFNPDDETFESFKLVSNFWNGYGGDIFIDNLGLAMGPDGRIWVNVQTGNPARIGWVDPETKEYAVFPAEPKNSWMSGGSTDIAVNTEGDVWYSNSPRFSIPGLWFYDEPDDAFYYSGYDQVMGLVSDDVGNVWFVKHNPNRLGKIAIDRTITQYNVEGSDNLWLTTIFVGPAGDVWFSDYYTLYRFDPDTETFKTYTPPSFLYYPRILFDSQHHMWLSTSYKGIYELSYNSPPTADAGADQVVEATSPAGAYVVLDGSGSSDPDGDPLTYTWTGPFGTATGVGPAVIVPLGTYEVTLTVDDGNGETGSDTVSITVQDTTPPVITIAGVEDGATYALGLVPEASYTAEDTVSGVAESSASLTGGDGLGLGTFIYTVTATDGAGNTATASVTYNVIATPEGLLALINQMVSDGRIAPQMENSLESMATGILGAPNANAQDGKLQAFMNHVEAQSGKKIDASAAAILINAAQYIQTHN